MIACGEVHEEARLRASLERLRRRLSKNCCHRPWHMAPRTLTWSPAPRPLPTLPSRRHSLRLTRITPTRFVVAYNDSRGASQPHQLLRRIGLHRRRHHLHPPHQRQRSKPLRQYLWRPRCSVQQANRHLVHGLARWQRRLQGLGGYKSTTPSDPNSWTHFCVHTNGGDDRESGWADNNPASPFFGRMYVSWNDFNVGAGASGRHLLH